MIGICRCIISSVVALNVSVALAVDLKQVGCSGFFTFSNTKNFFLPAVIWDQRLKRRLQNGLGGVGNLSIVHQLLNPSPSIIEKEKTQIELNSILSEERAILKKMNIVEDFNRSVELFKKKFLKLSELLGHLGVKHILYSRHKTFIILILPGAESSLNKIAKDLHDTNGSLLVVSDHARSNYKVEENTLHLVFKSILDAKISERESEIIKRVKASSISEIEIVTSNRSEVNNFMIDKESAIPGVLRFMSISTAPGSILEFEYRNSFRTGLLSSLASSAKEGLEILLKVHRHSGKLSTAMALRGADGNWQQSFAYTSEKNSNDGFLNARAYNELKEKIGQRQSGDKEEKLPDLFLLRAGQTHFTPFEVEYIRALAADPAVGLNSISLVLLNQTNSYGPIYYIHTLSMKNVFDTTVYADQLQTLYHRSSAISDGTYSKEFEPRVGKD